jgi:tRNA-specific 2-thiouridylase
MAAALLQQQGYEVIGMTLRLWTDPAHPSASDSVLAASHAAESLKIPFHVVDITGQFRREIVQFFLDEYARGVTPNPCVRCNRLVKWGVLLEQADALGAAFLSTGHYARLRQTENGHWQLLRALDRSKDQSYVLHVLTQEKLARAIFPVGNHLKEEIRHRARALGLPAASRSESQDLCFLNGEDYRDFIRRNAPEIARPGPILDRLGKMMGEHKGLAYYTIGQRKGLNVASPVPLYVLAKDPASNSLVVGVEEELGSSELTVGEVNWIAGEPPTRQFHALVKTRYTAREALAVIEVLGENRAAVRFDDPQRDITPGQAAVFYEEDLLLGGGRILQPAHSQSMI